MPDPSPPDETAGPAGRLPGRPEDLDALARDAYRAGARLLPALLVIARSLTEPQRLHLYRHCDSVISSDPGAWHAGMFLIRGTIILHSHFGQPGPNVDAEMAALARVHLAAYAAGGALLMSRDRPYAPGSTEAVLVTPWTLAGLELPEEQA